MDIEIYCEKCHALSHEISVEESEDDHEFSCTKCGAEIHWRNCPKCKTGYQSAQAGAPCPDCPP